MAKLKLKTQLLFFFIILVFVHPKASKASCILNIEHSSSIQNSNCNSGNCCRDVFNEYLYALGLMANETGQIYLNSTQQNHCFPSKHLQNNGVLGCRIERLTGGYGGCSSYRKVDVLNKLGNMVSSLDEDCRSVNSGEEHEQKACSSCYRRWEEIGGLSNDGDEFNSDTHMCSFAVLITVTSNIIHDKKRVQAIYDCLSGQNYYYSLGNEQTGSATSGDKRRTRRELILIIGLVGLAAIVLIAVPIWIFCSKKTPPDLSSVNNGSCDPYCDESKISPKEIYLATNNLNEANLIGRGIAGKVYRGILLNGQPVAVKHIINDGYAETFVREITSLSHIRHPNLVGLLGFCEHNDECFLVYELCHNGNLSQWLYGKDKVLSWNQRLQIAIGSARGLWFLHTYPEGCIVHRDIKPTNILIDAEFQAKLSDFGLSKVMDIGQSYVSSEVRGTFGYVDPEYRRNHRVNAKGDVYSYGIVLLQIVSGQRVINLNSDRPMQLNKMAKFLSRGGDITEFADPKLNGDYSVEALDMVIKLALSCTGIKPERPSMEQVVLGLERALDKSIQMKSITY
ncbi:probable LRR receptor-like serine/threonine-protein kinase MEE39 [Euphorbia lathyris]|uniref:probable LRR receptor-like serine/threonine-protein kinase MEE39 n=1 Tax=Euphorbia lathyris TaxID=212925 RepID=UPI0033139623